MKLDGCTTTRSSVLALLTVQNAGAVLLMRAARAVPAESAFVTQTAVVMQEAIKGMLSIILLLAEGGRLANTVENRGELLRMGVPAILYLVQNNLQYAAISHLQPPVYAICYQTKILWAAVCSMALLNKQLSKQQWAALLLMMLGVALVQGDGSRQSGGALGRAASPGANLGGELLGTALTLLAALCSSLAGVSFQGLLQGSAASLWTRNCQLAGYGFAAGLATLAASPDWRTVASAGFFHGYTALTWTCIAMNSCGGLVVGMALKYADAILKDMAIGLSICVSAVGAMLLFGFVVNSYFIIGSTFVIYGTVLYTDSLPAFSLFNPRRHPEPCRPYLEVEATELGAAQARG